MVGLNRTAIAAFAALAMCWLAQPAAAEIQVPSTHDSATCQIGALAALIPGIPILSASLQQSTGWYQMGGDGTCVKVDGDPGETTNSKVYSVHLQSSGTYFSNLCGSVLTLFAGNPLATQLTSQTSGWEGPVSLTYRIDTAGSSGVVGGPGAVVVLTASNSQRTQGVAGSGYAEALAAGTSDCISNGITQVGFELALSFIT
jgi:hypothetical protein